jgi:Xaa-Pro aminopeptidase
VQLWTNLRLKPPHLQLPQNEAQASDAEPFQPLVEELKRLNPDDPQLAHQTAQIVRFYRRLYESYVAKESESQRFESANGELRAANIQFCQERDYLKIRHAKQEQELAYFRQAFDNLGTGIGRLLRSSKGCTSAPMCETPTQVNEEGL